MHTRCSELQKECVLFIVVVYGSKLSLLSDPRGVLSLSASRGEKFHLLQTLKRFSITAEKRRLPTVCFFDKPSGRFELHCCYAQSVMNN